MSPAEPERGAPLFVWLLATLFIAVIGVLLLVGVGGLKGVLDLMV